MKKKMRIVLLMLLAIPMLFGCQNKQSQSSDTTSADANVQEAYRIFLLELYEQDPTKNTNTFLIRDLDGNGVEELIYRHQALEVTFYTYDNGIKKIDYHDFQTGTTRLFVSDNPAYPGFFEFHIGGGLEYYNYITIEKAALNFKKLWDDDFSDSYEGRDKIVEYTTDKQMIAESKKLYQENKDVEFIPLESIAEN